MKGAHREELNVALPTPVLQRPLASKLNNKQVRQGHASFHPPFVQWVHV